MDKHYVSYGSCCAGSCGASKDITGCRFSLSPMSDDFIDIILSSISKVDTSKIWSKTDRLSTIYRGKRCHVIDALKACFVYSYRKDVHSTMEITLSKGCPGDTDAESHLADDDALLPAALSGQGVENISKCERGGTREERKKGDCRQRQKHGRDYEPLPQYV